MKNEFPVFDCHEVSTIDPDFDRIAGEDLDFLRDSKGCIWQDGIGGSLLWLEKKQ